MYLELEESFKLKTVLMNKELEINLFRKKLEKILFINYKINKKIRKLMEKLVKIYKKSSIIKKLELILILILIDY